MSDLVRQLSLRIQDLEAKAQGAAARGDDREVWRLRGKIEGLSLARDLALTYLEER